MTTPPASQDTAIADLITFARLRPYLVAARGDVAGALALYRWNIDMSGAVYKMLHIVEVVLRNTIDAELRVWNATQIDSTTGKQHGPGWTLDTSRLLRRLIGRDLEKARRRARRAAAECSMGSRSMTHDDVIAQLTLGTWRYMLPGKDSGRQRLWNDALRRGFPDLTRNADLLVNDIERLYRVRNRAAHLEPILQTGSVLSLLAAARRVLLEIEPHAEEWLATTQTITSVVRSRPDR